MEVRGKWWPCRTGQQPELTEADWNGGLEFFIHTEKMKRKVAKAGKLRLSPNEEALLLKEELDRRRKLRLQQVREQERFIALQIRQDVKQRRDEQLQQLAEELKAEWQKAQVEKLRALERLYLAGLKAVGEGHQQAKENEPDLKAIADEVAVRKQRAEKRHRAALKELKLQKERELNEQSRHIKARQQALQAEKERATKIASLPPPPPDPFMMIEEVKRIRTVKVSDIDSFSVTHYHLLEACVDREMDTKQPDARLAAEEEAKRIDDLQKDDAKERREQLEKARLRGNHALKMVHLVQDRQKLLKELEQMQNEDLARRRQIVAQMPPQLFEPAYRRVEIKEDWQRALECAFEDIYTEDRKVKGDMILHLEPEPLPVPSVQTKDEDLDLSMEPEHVHDTQQQSDNGRAEEVVSEPVPAAKEFTQPPSNLVLKKLLNKIRTQKNHWMSKAETETLSDTIESGSLPIEERGMDGRIADQEPHPNTPFMEPPQFTDNTIVAGKSILLHPQEQATRIRMAADQQKQAIEQQKQQQLALLQQLEQEKLRLEADFLKLQAQLQENKKKDLQDQVQMNTQCTLHQNEEMEQKNEIAIDPEIKLKEDDHLQMIHNYQQRLLQQNRQHQQSVEEARKRLEEYQNLLKKRYPSISTTPLDSAAATVLECMKAKSTTGTILQSVASEMFQSKVHSVTHEPSELVHSQEQHKKAVDEARRQLQEYQILLRRKYSFISSAPLDSVTNKETEYMNQQSEMEPFLQGEAVEMLHSRIHSKHKVFEQSYVEEAPEPVISHSVLSAFSEKWSEKTDEDPVAGSSRVFPAVDVCCSKQGCFQEEIRRSNSPQLLQMGVYDAPSDTEIKQFPKSTGQIGSVCTRIPQKVEVEQIGLSSPTKNYLDQSAVQKSPSSSKQQVLKRVSATTNWVPETLGSRIGQAESLDALDCQQVPVQDSREAHLELSHSQPFLPSAVQQELHLHFHDHSAGPGEIQEHRTKNSSGMPLPNFSSVLEFRERLLVSTQEIQAQQEQVKALQLQLDCQREALLSKQRLQDELLLQKQSELKQQVQRQQEAMEHFPTDQQGTQTSFPVDVSKIQKNEQFNWISSMLHALENKRPEKADHCNSDESQSVLGREQRWRPLKPPVTKTKQGLILEPHELSTIPEMDSPRSGRPSAVGSMNAVGGESSLLSAVSDPDSSTSPRRETDLSRISTSSKDQNFCALREDSSRQSSRLSWRERLMLDAGLSRDSGQCRDSVVVHDMPSYAADIGRGVMLYPGSQCRPKSQAPLSQASLTSALSPQACTKDAVSDDLSSTTISTGSILTNERLESQLSNLENSSCSSDLGPWPDSTASIGLDPAASPSSTAHSWQEITFKNQESQLPPQSRSRIQQIIDKYTKDLNWPFEENLSWHAVGFDFSYMDQSSFQQHHFCPLEPRLDVSSSSCEQSQKLRYSEDPAELSKDSVFSRKSQDLSLAQESKAPNLQGNSNGSCSSSFGILTSHSFALPVEGSSRESIAHDSSGSFHQLQPESTLDEQNLITDDPVAATKTSGQSFEQSTAKEFVPLPTTEKAEELAEDIDNLPNLQASVENLWNQKLNSFEEAGSFHELRETQDIIHDSALSEHSVRDCLDFTKESSCSFELSVLETDHASIARMELVGVNLDNQNVDKEMHRCVDKSESHPYPLGESQVSALQAQSGMLEQTNLETLEGTLELKIVQNRSLFKTIDQATTISSGTCSLQNCIPAWDTESGHGIMEEPELTLISLNDSAVTVPDLEHPNQEENRECQIDNLQCVTDDPELRSSSRSGFLPLLSEVDNSIVSGPETVIDQCSIVKPPSSQRFAAMQLVFESPPGSLQEAFLKRKTDFIQRSRKRLDEIKRQEQTSGKTGATNIPKSGPEKSQLQKEHSPSEGAIPAGSQLKKVGEVKVCTPEDRKSVEIQMYQRTLRLYNQLNEVQTKKEEKARQESYAKNREKAKEFQKKTLQKLRSKK
ncbi:centrosomal protein of 295 kDa isoform X2 [Rhinatrema bivittatum]|uniref:centrosomal protein of 295 kDa isoform X2 n=1 Tax=Rhinatrema bivittatum TaxID=194408 RepID=UPI001128AE9C|nr:centrosomal protein of 295 kDa isoform X2 [Rhinatrema bivittatum]